MRCCRRQIEDVAPYGVALDRATVRQRKTGQPVRFELTEPTRDAVDDYIKSTGKKPGDFLFSGRHGDASISTRQYGDLFRLGLPKSDWIPSSSAPIRFAERKLL
jgi:hypothetical protein